LGFYTDNIPLKKQYNNNKNNANDKAVIATSRQSTLLVSCLETSQPSLALAATLRDGHQQLEHHRGTLC
jgi:hypothetical protein